MNGPLKVETKSSVQIVEAHERAFLETIRELFREYEAAIKVDLCFQGFERELAELPGAYAPPKGRLLMALVDGSAAGCIGVREIESGVCEMKRLYVRPAFRGMNLGRSLVEAAIEGAREAGYIKMRLDTMPFMREAIALYRAIGFREIEGYRFNPSDGALYFELGLK